MIDVKEIINENKFDFVYFFTFQKFIKTQTSISKSRILDF